MPRSPYPSQFDFEIPKGRPGTLVESFGIHVALKSNDLIHIQNDTPVLFNTRLNNPSPGISYDVTTGIFTIKKNGDYLVNWQISTDRTYPDDNVTFSLTVDGNNYSTISTLPVTGQISGTTLVVVDDAPSTVSLVNTSGSTITLIDTEAKANLVITGILVENS